MVYRYQSKIETVLRYAGKLLILLVIWGFLLSIIILTNTAIANAATVADVGKVGMSARPRALGGAFVALADDSNSIFLNPGGLGFFKSWHLTSMKTTLLSMVNYTTLAGAANTPYGNWAIGMIDAGSPAGYVTTRDQNGVNTNTGVPINFSSRLFLVGAGAPSTSLPLISSIPHLGVGFTVKGFQETFSGISPDPGTAMGYDMDLGLLWKIHDNLSIGVLHRNALPNGFGGQIQWSNGTVDDIPTLTKIGAAFSPNTDWTALLDADISYRGLPIAFHAGAEWRPASFIALRAGVNQNEASNGAGGSTVTTALTAGVGLRLGTLGFDYSYQTDPHVSDNAAHYFSLSIFGKNMFPEAPPAVPVIPSLIEIWDEAGQPISQLTTDDKQIKLRGIVRILATTAIQVNASIVPLKDQKFEIKLQIPEGANAISLIALDEAGRVLDKSTFTVTRRTAAQKEQDNVVGR